MSGCVKRKVLISSEPPGAICYFDGELVGETPTEAEFVWYGGHRISLRKEGYQPLSEIVHLRAPVYQYVPLDLAAELWPTTITDRHEFHYTLVPEGAEPVADGAAHVESCHATCEVEHDHGEVHAR